MINSPQEVAHSSADIEVLTPGLFSTVQGIGLTGYRHLGIPIGGALDSHALILGNRLLGNPDNTHGIELTSGKVELKFNRDSWFVVTGAQYQISIGDRNIWSGWRNKIKAGETLTLKGPSSKMHAYLTIDGGIVQHSPLGIGGSTSQALGRGDRLQLGKTLSITKPIGAVQRGYCDEIRALPGPEMSLFTATSRKAFWHNRWQLTNASNRMGARLDGEALSLSAPKELNSHAVMPGVVQVPPSGQPIVLLADAQTTGGYPKIATVIEADLWKLAQTRPGQSIRFVHVSPSQADDANYEWQQYFYRLQRAMNGS
ncbi:biotin-dependent carboxyltransferase family protein [Shewanella nanhaiensis]|uniref:Biotin-dependent carboxyltransferase family protein n=1 Tax=Shewanella nanhaiensis TaxID=2864872 RepID=A0ABS7E8R2_9GAMM|nr:biotin-dependent carboxyltransferase family protein [Shewanella nanhaiensis]MBW8186078.1 biotin-dependent carboxyltransferase family protein [Shewanella nanhaiensis]